MICVQRFPIMYQSHDVISNYYAELEKHVDVIDCIKRLLLGSYCGLVIDRYMSRPVQCQNFVGRVCVQRSAAECLTDVSFTFFRDVKALLSWWARRGFCAFMFLKASISSFLLLSITVHQSVKWSWQSPVCQVSFEPITVLEKVAVCFSDSKCVSEARTCSYLWRMMKLRNSSQCIGLTDNVITLQI